MVDEQDKVPGPDRSKEIDGLYAQLARSAARIMVVHQAGEILRSTHDREELAHGLLDTIAEAVFSATGCVAALDGGELAILATRGLEDHEMDSLAADAGEAEVWFAVADGEQPKRREALVEELDLGPDPDEEDHPQETPLEEAWANDPGDDGDGGDVDTAGGDGDIDDAGHADDAFEEETPEPSSAPRFEIYLPLRVEDRILGVLALGERVDGQPLSFEDEQLALSLSSHLALAINHAALFEERSRRIEQLNALLKISKEITSTLDLDRVLSTICQMTGMVLPNRRTLVALVTGGKVSVRASSDPEFKLKDETAGPFLDLLRWAHGARCAVNTCRMTQESDPDEEGRDLILPWLNREDGPRGLAVLPLEDDQGILGLLAIETDPDETPLDDESEELITILANQTTVAIRNAELYQQVPMIGVLEPILGKARRARRGSRRKLVTRLAVAAAVLAVGFLAPLPSWVAGDADVRPAGLAAVRAATEGTVDEVLVTEGERVARGAVVARLRRDLLEVELERVRASAQRTRAEAARARSQGDLAGYRGSQAALNQCFETESFLLGELERTTLAAPTDGVILTPKVGLLQGTHLARGDLLLEMADVSRMEVEVLVSEANIEKIEVGRGARLKVHAYPRRTFRGEVIRVAPRANAGGEFRVTALIENPDEALRSGMSGRAHLAVPSEPAFQRWLRPLARGIRLRSWF